MMFFNIKDFTLLKIRIWNYKGLMTERKMYLQKKLGKDGKFISWYLRRPVPKDLQGFIPAKCQTEIAISLRTKNLGEARRVYHEHWIEFERVLKEARALKQAGTVANDLNGNDKQVTGRELVTKRASFREGVVAIPSPNFWRGENVYS